MGEYGAQDPSPQTLPEFQMSNCGPDPTANITPPPAAIRQNERDFESKPYSTVYTTYGGKRYGITIGAYSNVALSIAGQNGTGPGWTVSINSLLSEGAIVKANDSQSAPIAYNYQTSAPWP